MKNTLSEDWCRKIQETLAQIRREISNKADKSLVEQIKRQEVEKKRVFSKVKLSPADVGTNNESTAKICNEMVEKGDLDTAFLSVLRHIENISQTKADADEIYEKATRDYVEQLFDELDTMNRDKLLNKSKVMNQTIEQRLQEITDQFDSFAEEIENRLDNCSDNLVAIEQQISDLSTSMQIKYTSQISKKKAKKDPSTSLNTSEFGFSQKKRIKQKESSIVYPIYYTPKPEPTAKELCMSVTVTSKNKMPRSLIVTD